jgi:HEAT repeat protein/PBS lyase HEAT-like repeat-containing protein
VIDDAREPTPDLRSDTDVPAGIRYDPDLAVHEPAEVPGENAPPSRRRSALVLFPLGLAGLAVAVYVVFGLIANEGMTPSDYLNEIRLRRTDAWEPAFRLSQLLARKHAAGSDSRFVPELIQVFESAQDEDPRVRRYLALSLGEVHDRRAVDALDRALQDPDAQTVLYAAWALGTIGDARAAPDLIPLLEHQDPGLRKIAAYALGALDSPEALGPLRGLLNDPVEDVAWNAALSLARRGDRTGLPLLLRMLDRSYLERQQRPDESGRPRALTEDQKEEAIRNALSSLVLLRDTDHLDVLRGLRDSDPNLRVRQAAFESLAALDTPVRR